MALNLAGVEHHELARGDAVVTPGSGDRPLRFDASLEVLAALDHEVSRRGAYVAYLGSRRVPRAACGSWVPTRSRRAAGRVRSISRVALPLVPGDRFVLRESGRNETVGGGEVLDVAPVHDGVEGRPDRPVDARPERGWVDVDELELLTGEAVDPTVGRWVTRPACSTRPIAAALARSPTPGPFGLDLAALDERERAAVGPARRRARRGGPGPLGRRRRRVRRPPAARRAPRRRLAPPESTRPSVESSVSWSGASSPSNATGWCSTSMRSTRRRAGTVALLRDHADGVTMAQLRDAFGVPRKYALPLVNELDARGITRRRGDLRIGGPRLPRL